MWDVFLLALCSNNLFFLIVGTVFLKKPPIKESNGIGFRTKFAMKNEKTWEYANKLCSKLLIYIALILLIPSIILPILLKNNSNNSSIILSIYFLFNTFSIVFIPVILTNIFLHKQFDNNGDIKVQYDKNT